MKISVSTIIHFQKAANVLTRYLRQQLENADQKRKNELYEVTSAIQTVDNMSKLLTSSELTIKGN